MRAGSTALFSPSPHDAYIIADYSPQKVRGCFLPRSFIAHRRGGTSVVAAPKREDISLLPPTNIFAQLSSGRARGNYACARIFAIADDDARRIFRDGTRANGPRATTYFNDVRRRMMASADCRRALRFQAAKSKRKAFRRARRPRQNGRAQMKPRRRS